MPLKHTAIFLLAECGSPPPQLSACGERNLEKSLTRRALVASASCRGRSPQCRRCGCRSAPRPRPAGCASGKTRKTRTAKVCKTLHLRAPEVHSNKRQRSAERHHHARPIFQQLRQIGSGAEGEPRGEPRWRATLARFRLSRSQDQHRRLRPSQRVCINSCEPLQRGSCTEGVLFASLDAADIDRGCALGAGAPGRALCAIRMMAIPWSNALSDHAPPPGGLTGRLPAPI